VRLQPPLQRCGVCIASVEPQGNVRLPLGGSSHFLHSNVTYSAAALYISPPTAPPHSVASPPPLYATAHTATSLRQLPRGCPSTAAGPASQVAVRGRPADQQRGLPLSSPPAHSRDLHVTYSSSESLEADFHEPADLSGLSQRVERRVPATAQNILPAGIVPGVALRPSP
jgi:hypothetical protein